MSVETVPLKNLEPEIVMASSLADLYTALQNPETNAALYRGRTFEYQTEVEAFNESGENVYIAIPGHLQHFRSLLDEHLKSKGFVDETARVAFVNYIFGLTDNHVRKRGLEPGTWDVTVTSTFLQNTRQREWHIDSYDSHGKTLQLNSTLAGDPGTVISSARDYDRAAFATVRDERRKLEAELVQEKAKIDAKSKNRTSKALLTWQLERRVRRKRQLAVLEMEKLLYDMPGYTSRAQDIILFRGGEVPHTSPVLDRRRLVFTLVEFDEFMSETPVT